MRSESFVEVTCNRYACVCVSTAANAVSGWGNSNVSRPPSLYCLPVRNVDTLITCRPGSCFGHVKEKDRLTRLLWMPRAGFWEASLRQWQNDAMHVDVRDRVFMSPVKPLSSRLPLGLHMTLIPSASPKSSHKHQSTIRSSSCEDVPTLAKILKETDRWQYAIIIDSWSSGVVSERWQPFPRLYSNPGAFYSRAWNWNDGRDGFWHRCLQATMLKSTSPEPLCSEMNLQAFRGNEKWQKSLFKFKACSFQLSVLYLKLASSDTFGSFLCEHWEKSTHNLAFKHNKTGRDDSRWIRAFRCSSWPTVWPSPNWPWSILSQFAPAIRTNAATDTGS